MLKWALHMAIAAIGIVAFERSNIDSPSVLESVVYPLGMWVALIYGIVVAIKAVFGWPGPSDHGLGGRFGLGAPRASDVESGGSGDGD